MKRVRYGFAAALALLMMLPVVMLKNAHAQTADLRIVVIEGEDAVNVIQQKTAVAPVVEVRDRNDQPVSGAVVRFAIQGGRASFNGARTLTVTTNAAGRAAVTGLTPTGSGAFQITASAAFQGQTAAATIAQTNVMTLAQTGAAGTSGAGSAAGGAGGGGGVSATTLGIVGGAVAGGTILTKEVLLNQGAGYQGTFRLDTVNQIRDTRGGVVVAACTSTMVITGTVTLEIDEHDGTVTGDLIGEWAESEVARTCSAPRTFIPDSIRTGQINSPASNIQFNNSFSGPGGAGGQLTRMQAFSGALSGDAINGTWTMSYAFTSTLPNGDIHNESYPATGGQMTLQKQ